MKAYKNIFILLFALTVLSGCDKGLDLAPKDQVSDPYFWKTSDDFQLATNDFYFSLQEAPQYIDRNSDIAFGGSPDEVSNGSFLVPANYNIWDDSYEFIRSINYLLMKAEESDLEEEIDRWVGEALFFRAYNYWRLVKQFGGVPKITIVLDVTSPELYTAKSTQAEIIDFIIEDLDKALSKLPLQSEIASDDMGRVSRGAALALKSRVALFQGTWSKYRNEGNWQSYIDKAIDASTQLINSGEYDLFTEKGDDSYKYLFILEGDDSREVILARRYYIQRVHHNWTRELWFNAMIPTKNMADLYLSTDGLPITKSSLFQGYNTLTSEFENRDPRMGMTFIVPGSSIFFEGGIWQPTFPGFTGTNATQTGYMLRKFLGENLDAAQFRSDYDLKEFRLGEVLLILAEALYEKNGSISDADLDKTINRLRTRVNMPKLTNTFVTSNGLNMLDEIRRERTVELAFEGFRRDDLRRWKTAETVLTQSLRGIKFVGTEYQSRYPDLKPGTDITVDEAGFIVTDPASARKFVSPKNYLYPLPSQQVQLSNGTLVQNEGWN
ncbi:hypothetical protein M2459_000422 [Parabacteroides sp. PF5-5]|uniref:RagB/SusD family nutrient uptake outer membrane protein n=1 Tax=unclassified Parabacteroides TaxID=2649774 RepID=UPI002475528E|nr:MULTISPECIES: RagB/SusD family nutrient uptake outer membrane protein [unclassified Parabacteroides]MDH6303644.1 hypothetical protein [Parabacteroides sp. PH5-39]MDH6314966.1 hypothetical protein [Parabacteroides sp. PF5-13]MDH6318303.1 hypothetical protein [Parabacteroides sp. PH5-13]MDH6321764.1 hypothetical protein [Parabacteroides sp. PH5-8]MDH6325888.1 hypothetical protein [Parabacteroides sp. PH5-41]